MNKLQLLEDRTNKLMKDVESIDLKLKCALNEISERGGSSIELTDRVFVCFLWIMGAFGFMAIVMSFISCFGGKFANDFFIG